MADRFPSPFDIETPEGAEGWEEMYVYSSLFSEHRRKSEDTTFGSKTESTGQMC